MNANSTPTGADMGAPVVINVETDEMVRTTSTGFTG
jgi:hypothetical protein